MKLNLTLPKFLRIGTLPLVLIVLAAIAVVVAMARYAYGIGAISDLLGGRHEVMQIGMIACQPPLAGRTSATGVAVRGGRITQQAGCQRLGQLALAQPGRANEQQRVRQAIAEFDEARPRVLQPGVNHAPTSAATMRSMSARINSGARLASSTRMRCGAMRARSR